MSDIQNILNPSSFTALSSLSMSFPFPVYRKQKFQIPKYTDELPFMYDLSLQRRTLVDGHEFSSLNVFRGLEALNNQDDTM